MTRDELRKQIELSIYAHKYKTHTDLEVIEKILSDSLRYSEERMVKKYYGPLEKISNKNEHCHCEMHICTNPDCLKKEKMRLGRDK